MTVPEATPPALHPRVAAAAEGELPPWAHAGAKRRAHMERVARLLDEWAAGLSLPAVDQMRWPALGYLHDCLRDAPPEALRPLLEPPFDAFPGPMLHGPAAAARLAEEGVTDGELLDAIRYHTLGHPRLGAAGRALFAADFLEPGREHQPEWREALRARMPEEMESVVKEILRARIVYLVGEGRPVRPETMAFWNSMAGGESWARASEL